METYTLRQETITWPVPTTVAKGDTTSWRLGPVLYYLIVTTVLDKGFEPVHEVRTGADKVASLVYEDVLGNEIHHEQVKQLDKLVHRGAVRNMLLDTVEE